MENERDGRVGRVIQAGRQMLTAARTAPKGRGVDIIECALLDKDDIARVSETMKVLYAETGREVYNRDSDNIMKADAMFVVATRDMPLGLNCRPLRFCDLRREACGVCPAQ